jgi:SOS-response transcriptional repressor LexA
MNALGPRQKETLGFISAKLKINGVAPTIGEICLGLGLSANSRSLVHKTVSILVERGYLRRMKGRARAIEVVQPDYDHAPDCPCDECAHTRYLAQLKLVQALQVAPPVALAPKLVGLRAVSHLNPLCARKIESSGPRRKPRLVSSKPSKDTLHQRSSRSV